MANFFVHQFSNLVLVVFVLISCYSLQLLAADEDRKVFIVYMGHLHEADHQSFPSYHLNMLRDVVDSTYAAKSLVRSYTRSFNGFAAYLTPQEKEKLAGHQEVVSIFPSTTFKLQTTRSWDFMGLTSNVKRDQTTESDTIIGVIDSGIWPESDSFNDKGFSPPPKKWKGACNGGYNFTCNNKLIGARYYTEESTRDKDGHGTHTASTAAGNYVEDVSFYGIAKGRARGGVPSARIAAYKACNNIGCGTEDILAAFDDCIADGVDVISVSLGPHVPLELQEDPIAIGALHATQNGILVIQSAGNEQSKKSVASVAPWIFSVAASSSDRGIIAKVALGDGAVLTGKAVNTVGSNGTIPVVYGNSASRRCDEEYAKLCYSKCLEPDLVKGKIVLCNTFGGIDDAARAGALGVVVLNDFSPDVASVVPPMPISALKNDDFNLLESYFNSTKSPKVEIMASDTIRNVDAPMVASFSSRGPNLIIPDILKPDVTAPGTEIIAAYSPLSPPSYLFPDYDKRSVKYNILAGTSMSCPHVAGASAYVKSLHPNWSPSAIKSALMTTAWRMDTAKDSLAEFAYGVGHIDPAKAADPGLVYETPTNDYVKMLCSLGFDGPKMRKIFGGNSTCPTGAKTMPKDLNYPSMSIGISQGNSTSVTFSAKFRRTVTNVGDANSTYKVKTSESQDYRIVVKPNILKFGAVNEKKSFEVTIRGKTNGSAMVSASLEWSDGVHNVRSPIVLYTDNL